MEMASKSMPTIQTRENVYLIKTLCDDITGAKLPSNGQVLQYFLNLHRIKKKTIRVAAGEVTDKVLQFWEKANIPVRHKPDCVNQVNKLFDKWNSLKNNSSRKTETQKLKENEFTDTFENLFDIAHVNALNLMKIKEDKDFLIAQREKGRRGAMSSLDKVLLERQKRKEETLEKLKKRKLSVEEEDKKYQALVVLESSSTSSTDSDPGPSSLQTLPTVKKRGRK